MLGVRHDHSRSTTWLGLFGPFGGLRALPNYKLLNCFGQVVRRIGHVLLVLPLSHCLCLLRLLPSYICMGLRSL